MNIFFKFLFSFWGVLGKGTLNPEVLKCHEDLITLDTYVQQGKTMDNKFYIYVKTLTLHGLAPKLWDFQPIDAWGCLSTERSYPVKLIAGICICLAHGSKYTHK